MSKYQSGKSMDGLSEWIINNLTNIDPTSLTPYQETMLEGQVVLSIVVFVILLFKR